MSREPDSHFDPPEDEEWIDCELCGYPHRETYDCQRDTLHCRDDAPVIDRDCDYWEKLE